MVYTLLVWDRAVDPEARFGQLGTSQTNDQRNTQVALKLTF
jgi:hypothetical protein